jgi:hypothetical protein
VSSVRELQPAAAGLIRAALANDTFSSEHIVAAVDESGQDGLVFALIVADMAGRILAEVCGSNAQAVALADDWIGTAARVCAREAA